MTRIPTGLRHWISRLVFKWQAKQIWRWLQTNSNTVIVDELEQAVRARRDWHAEDET